ncbi:MAG: histidine phosphatase family protein [Burkholderiaceae bacterium]
MKLWLARHAQPLIASGICYGVTDVAADENLTLLAAEALAKVLPPRMLCRVSPLRRCQQLASALQQIRPDCLFNPATDTDARLAEMDFGHFEGQPWSAIPKADVDAWTAHFGTHRFGGKESANDVLQRVAHALRDIQAQQQAQKVDDVLWITHAGVIRAATLLARGKTEFTQTDTAEQWPREVPAFGSFMRLVF